MKSAQRRADNLRPGDRIEMETGWTAVTHAQIMGNGDVLVVTDDDTVTQWSPDDVMVVD